jgi:hypothetical protein
MAGTFVAPTTGIFSGLTEQGYINAMAAALASMSGGTTAPTLTNTGLASLAGLWWHDTSTNIIKIRDQADTTWIPVFLVDETSKTIRAYGSSEQINPQTGTSYAVLATDLSKLVTFLNAAAIAVTLPQAIGTFGSGWYVDVENRGAGAVTITPTTSTIDGVASLVLQQNSGVRIASDGTNFYTLRGINPAGFAQTGSPNTFTALNTFAGLGAKQSYQAGGQVSANVSAGHVALDFSLGNSFVSVTAGAFTIDNPTNALAGQSGAVMFTGTLAAAAITFGTNWHSANGVRPTQGGGNDMLFWYCYSPTYFIFSYAAALS